MLILGWLTVREKHISILIYISGPNINLTYKYSYECDTLKKNFNWEYRGWNKKATTRWKQFLLFTLFEYNIYIQVNFHLTLPLCAVYRNG